EVCAWSNLQLRLLVHERKQRIDIFDTGRIEFQRILLRYTVRAAVHEQGHADRPGNGNAVFEAAEEFSVAAREGDGVTQDGNGESLQGRESAGPQIVVVVVADGLIELAGNIGDRGNRADVEPADVLLASHVEAAVGRHFLPAVTGGIGTQEPQADGVTLLVDGMEILELTGVGNGVDVATQRASRECQ